MVALARNWTVAINQQPSSQVDQAIQYRDLLYAFINAFRQAGWTIVRSSNGTTASNSDNIASSTDIVFGNSSQPRSWAILTPPDEFYGKGGSRDISEQLEILISAEESNADATPQNVTFRFGTLGTYTGSGSTTANPTYAGGVESTSLGSSYASAWIPWTTATNCRYAVWYNPDGEVMFGINATGERGFRHFFMARTFKNADEGHGNNRYLFFGYSSTSEGAAVGSNVVFAASYTRGRTVSGGGALQSSIATCPAWSYTSWTNGQENDRGIPASGIVVGNNSTAGNARYFGWIRDVYGGPSLANHNAVQDGDTDTIRLVYCSAISLGGLWLPVPAASLPLE